MLSSSSSRLEPDNDLADARERCGARLPRAGRPSCRTELPEDAAPTRTTRPGAVSAVQGIGASQRTPDPCRGEPQAADRLTVTLFSGRLGVRSGRERGTRRHGCGTADEGRRQQDCGPDLRGNRGRWRVARRGGRRRLPLDQFHRTQDQPGARHGADRRCGHAAYLCRRGNRAAANPDALVAAGCADPARGDRPTNLPAYRVWSEPLRPERHPRQRQSADPRGPGGLPEEQAPAHRCIAGHRRRRDHG